MNEATRVRLRRAVRSFYDLQRLRIQTGNRDSDRAELTDDDRKFMAAQSDGLEELEKQALKEISTILKGIAIYKWLKVQKGCGPTMSGVLLSEIDIHRAETCSSIWKYSGLDVDTRTGKARRGEKGVKRCWNSFLKTKCVGVLGDCMIKAQSPWTKHYYDYKHRKQTQMVPKCMACDGTGKSTYADGVESTDGLERANDTESTKIRKRSNGKRAEDKKKTTMAKRAPDPESTDVLERADVTESSIDKERAMVKKSPTSPKRCSNCNGTGGPAPWGRSDAHRHRASIRFMVKMFLLGLWKEWRTLEGLPTPDPYSEAKLGIKHGQHASLQQGEHPA